jgi:hypothetical protein
MKFIEPVLILYPQHNEKAGRNTNCETNDVNKGKDFILPE